jgi:hypothetical protein
MQEEGFVAFGIKGKTKFWDSCCHFCKYFEGEKKGTCPAYPGGIPDRFVYAKDVHVVIEDDQTGDFDIYVIRKGKIFRHLLLTVASILRILSQGDCDIRWNP